MELGRVEPGFHGRRAEKKRTPKSMDRLLSWGLALRRRDAGVVIDDHRHSFHDPFVRRVPIDPSQRKTSSSNKKSTQINTEGKKNQVNETDSNRLYRNSMGDTNTRRLAFCCCAHSGLISRYISMLLNVAFHRALVGVVGFLRVRPYLIGFYLVSLSFCS